MQLLHIGHSRIAAHGRKYWCSTEATSQEKIFRRAQSSFLILNSYKECVPIRYLNSVLTSVWIPIISIENINFLGSGTQPWSNKIFVRPSVFFISVQLISRGFIYFYKNDCEEYCVHDNENNWSYEYLQHSVTRKWKLKLLNAVRL